MKNALLFFSLVFSLVLKAQVKEYNDSTINVVLNKELNGIESKLYYAIINGKITAYKSDTLSYSFIYSITDTYSAEEAKFKESGNWSLKVKKGTKLLYSPLDTIIYKIFRIKNDSARNAARDIFFYHNYVERIKDYTKINSDKNNCYLRDTNYINGVDRYYIDNNYTDTVIPVFFKPDHLLGITAYYVQKNDFRDKQRNYLLDFISIDYQPTEGHTDPGIMAVRPMFYLEFKDLKKVLNKKEIDFINTFSNAFFGDEYYSPISVYDKEETYYENKLYGSGRKWSRICEASLKAASKEIFWQCCSLATIDKFANMFYKDSTLSVHADSVTYCHFMHYDETITVYPNPNDPYYVIDSVISVKRTGSDFIGVVFTKNSTGFVVNKSVNGKENSIIYIKRFDLYKYCEPWVAYILKEYY